MNPERNDQKLTEAFRRAFAARDERLRAPEFATIWPSEDRATRAPRTFSGWRVGLATAATIAFAGIVSWTLLRGPGGAQAEALDPAIAHELSRSDYWRVPSDELLALAAPPIDASLPSGGDFSVSLEESFL